MTTQYIAKYLICSELLMEERENLIRHLDSKLKSKEILFISRNEQFMIVSISKKQQHHLLKTFLKGYYNRLIEGSFLQHIYGVFKLVIKGNIYRLLIMENPKYGLGNPSTTIIKGNQLNRKRFESGNEIITDFQETIAESIYYSKNRQFLFSTEDRQRILSIFYEDIKFLRHMNVMEYNIEIYSGNRLDTRRNMFLHTKSFAQYAVFCIRNFLNMVSYKKCSKASIYALSSSEYAETVTGYISSIV